MAIVLYIIQPFHAIPLYGSDMAQTFRRHFHTFALVRVLLHCDNKGEYPRQPCHVYESISLLCCLLAISSELRFQLLTILLYHQQGQKKL